MNDNTIKTALKPPQERFLTLAPGIIPEVVLWRAVIKQAFLDLHTREFVYGWRAAALFLLNDDGVYEYLCGVLELPYSLFSTGLPALLSPCVKSIRRGVEKGHTFHGFI